MSLMFFKFTSLKSIYFSSINIQNVIDLYDMLSHCISLKSIDLSPFNTENVTNMASLFFLAHH